MSRRRPRGLSAEDEALWEKVVAKATPLAKKRSKLALPERVNPKPPPAPTATPDFTLRPFKVGETAQPRQIAPARIPAPAMDHKAYTRLKRGKLKPEARIDLHGLTLAQAHPRLDGFIQSAHASGKRLVLVITGKGRSGRDDGGPIPSHPGALRRQVPDWLARPPLGALVLQVTPANIRHGGDGAYYVYLRRRR